MDCENFLPSSGNKRFADTSGSGAIDAGPSPDKSCDHQAAITKR
jgi:hypothetical protein